MNHVRSSASYKEFIAGRDVDSAMHREDGGAGYCIGIVETPRAGDEVISATQYLAEAEAIQAYNAALPPRPPKVVEPTPIEALVKAISASADLPALKAKIAADPALSEMSSK